MSATAIDDRTPLAVIARHAENDRLACEVTMLRDERDLLRVQLQAFQGMPYVPKTDYERALERAESAERTIDAMAGEAANASDKRGNVALTRAHTVMREFVRCWAKEIEGSYSNLEKQDAWRAMLAEIAGGGR